MRSLRLLTLSILILAATSFSEPRVLIDGIHGWTHTGLPEGGIADPVELFPGIDFDILDASDIVLDEVLLSGTIIEEQDTVSFEVPTGTRMLVMRYEMTDTTTLQHPYFYFLDPYQNLSGRNFNGLAFCEDPPPGTWQMICSSWMETPIPFEVGISGYFYNSDLLAEYDAVLQLVDNTYQLFVGEIPPLSGRDQAILSEYLGQGGGYLLLRETDFMMVEKPFVRLYTEEAMGVDLRLDFPGQPTFHEPAAIIQRSDAGNTMAWSRSLDGDSPDEILYEGRLPDALHDLTAEMVGNVVRVTNQGPRTLNGLHLFSCSDDQYRYARFEQLLPGETQETQFTRAGSALDLSRHLHEALVQEALDAGLYPDEAAFLRHYHWINASLLHAAETGGLQAAYHFGGQDYDALIPAELSPVPREAVRAMWVFSRDLPAVPIKSAFEHPIPSPAEIPHHAATSLVFHEYGAIEELASRPRNGVRDLGLFDLQFHDEFLIDPTDNVGGDTWSPLFHTFGDNTLAAMLSTGVEQVAGSIAAPISYGGAPEALPILVGDADSYGEGNELFPAGSFPPVAVASPMGSGWFIGINDIHMLRHTHDNVLFLTNCLQFLTGYENRVRNVPDEYATIQMAIDSCMHGDTVLVAPGTYVEAINFLGKRIVVMSEEGADSTIIDGDSLETVVSFIMGEDSNTKLTGFTITNGYAGPEQVLPQGGGGIRCINASPSIEHNIISGNHCYWYLPGGGIYCNHANPGIRYNIIRENTGAYYGGGICLENQSHALIFGNEISGHLTMSGYGVAYGAGICVADSSRPFISNNLIHGNEIDFGSGAGIAVLTESRPMIYGNCIVNNINGAGIFAEFVPDLLIRNETIIGNPIGVQVNDVTPIVVNTILWDNNLPIDLAPGLREAVVVYSDVQGGWVGEGNLDVDPAFVDPEALDFNLQETSPCVDAGTAVFVHEGDSLVVIEPDLYEGNAPDMGALESIYVVSRDEWVRLPETLTLHPAYPNPFNPETTLRFSLPADDNVRLRIFDLQGREIRSLVQGQYPAGSHECVWNGRDASGRSAAAGIYLARLETESSQRVIKLALIR